MCPSLIDHTLSWQNYKWLLSLLKYTKPSIDFVFWNGLTGVFWFAVIWTNLGHVQSCKNLSSFSYTILKIPFASNALFLGCIFSFLSLWWSTSSDSVLRKHLWEVNFLKSWMLVPVFYPHTWLIKGLDARFGYSHFLAGFWRGFSIALSFPVFDKSPSWPEILCLVPMCSPISKAFSFFVPSVQTRVFC